MKEKEAISAKQLTEFWTFKSLGRWCTDIHGHGQFDSITKNPLSKLVLFWAVHLFCAFWRFNQRKNWWQPNMIGGSLRSDSIRFGFWILNRIDPIRSECVGDGSDIDPDRIRFLFLWSMYKFTVSSTFWDLFCRLIFELRTKKKVFYFMTCHLNFKFGDCFMWSSKNSLYFIRNIS